jgi:signal transduction histidine kinase/sensor domain CHASE-containing protein
MRRFVVFRVVSATVMLSGLIAAILLCSKLIDREQAELRYTTDANVRRIATQLQGGVSAALVPLERLGQWWLSQGKPMDREDWATDGRLFLSQSPGLRRAVWVSPERRQLWSASPGTAPDLARTVPEDRVLRTVALVGNNGQGAVSDVFDDAGIGRAFYVCFRMSKGGRVRGYVVGFYDVRALISAISTGTILREHRISITADGHPIYATRAGFAGGGATAMAPLRLENQLWTVELSVPLRYFQEFRGLILAIVGVIGALIYAAITLLTVSQKWSSALQAVNSALESEVERRARIEADVRALNRELSRRVADFETLLRVIPIGIAVAEDAQCRTIRVNRALADMLGLPEGANISKSADGSAGVPYKVMRNGQEIPPEELPMQAAAITGKAILGEEDEIVRDDGRILHVLSFAAPVFDEDGRVRGVLNACVDISDRKHLEQRLQRAERMKSLGAMAAGIAHDFNNLLTTILGQAWLASQTVPKDSEAMAHLTACADAGQQASALIHKVLAYTGHSTHSLRPTNVGETIASLEATLHAMAGSKAEVRLEISPQLPEVMADPDEVRQVVRNLVLNALEAAGSAGHIEISADLCHLSTDDVQLMVEQDLQPGAHVRVRIKDTGAGMPPEIAERAFDPFFSTKFLGRGLGLSEVLGIMRAHGGAVRLATAPAVGTTVDLFFPARKPVEGAGGNRRRAA